MNKNNIRLWIRFPVQASDPKWVNSISDIVGVNSLRLGGLQKLMRLNKCKWCYNSYSLHISYMIWDLNCININIKFLYENNCIIKTNS